VNRRLEAVVFADHNQFYVFDAEAPFPDLWSPVESERHLAAYPGFLGILTGSYGNVRVRLELGDSPDAGDANADHVVETSLEAPSGVLVVESSAGTAEGGTLELEPGAYRARVTWNGLEDADPVLVDEGPVETVTISFWPGEPGETRVVRWYRGWAPPSDRPVNPWGLRIRVGGEIDYHGARVVGVRAEPGGADTFLIVDPDGVHWESYYLRVEPYCEVLRELPPAELERFQPYPPP
jgi:hypothetical protein